MSTWTLLRYLNPFGRAIANPVVTRETTTPHSTRHISDLPRVWWLLMVVPGLVSCCLVLSLGNPLVLLVPLVALWNLLIGLGLAPSIARERERRTWETLRVTPLTTPTLVLSKATGALWHLRDLIQVSSLVMLIAAIGIGAIGPALIGTSLDGSLRTGTNDGLWALMVGLALLAAAVFVADRVQQFVLVVTATLAASASAPSTRSALTGASAAALIAWLLEVILAGILIAALPGYAAADIERTLVILAALGPAAGYLAALSPGGALACITSTLLIRELATRRLWAWTLRAASAD